jgi:hypothetical protein
MLSFKIIKEGSTVQVITKEEILSQKDEDEQRRHLVLLG